MGRMKLPPAMWTRSKLVKELDTIFSQMIRHRDDWRCQRCHKKYEPPTSALHCSHFWKRGYMGTRWDFDNCDAMCYGCHRAIEGDKQKGSWYYDWKLQKLGDRLFEKMQIRAQAINKFSHNDLELLLQVFQNEYGTLKS